MTSSGSNPFVFPGFTPGADSEHNPISASVEMMRGAWQNLAGAGVLGQADLTQPVTVEDLDRRIAQLKTIENWLQLNLSMLASTTQALQVQRATIATLKSFMGLPGTAAGADNPSPLEVALGIKPAGQAKIRPAQAETESSAEAADGEAAAAGPFGAMSSEAARNWWDMMQQQFNVLAAATASTMQAGQAAHAQATEAAKDAVKEAATGSSTTAEAKKSGRASTDKRATRPAARSAARKASTTKAGAAQKSTGK